MAIQKHNIYYDASKPESGIYYYAENGEQKELFLNNVLSGENGISAISAVDGNTWVIGITDDYKDNIEKIPGLSDNFVILSADVGNKLYVSATDNWDVLPYTGSTNISIHDHIIDFQNTANLIGDDTYIAVVSADNNIVVSALKDFVDKEYVDNAIASAAPTSAVANKLDKAVFSAYSADIALQLNNISADKLDTSAFTAYSAHALDDYYKKSDTSGKQEIQNALNEKQDNLTNEQLSAISSVSAIQSISANWLTEEDIEDFITEDEVESVSSTLTAQTNYLSGIINTKLDTTVFDTYTATALDDYYTKNETKGLINDLSGTVSNQLNNKLDTSTFAAYSGNINNQINTVSSEIDKKLYTSATNDWDVTPYSGINGIKVENHLISVSANYALSADVYSKSQIDDIIANFGGFQIVSEDAQGKPDVSDPSTKIIYLTLVDDDPAAFDKYREWIWTNSEWECIGIASIDLKDYAKTQDVITSAVATSAWINNTFYNKTETSGKTEIQNALDTKLDTTAFDNYSDNIDEQLQALSSAKLDTSAFTAYSADIESQLDTLSAIKLDKTYSATVNEQLTAKLDTSAFTTYSAEINTELNNITADVDKKLYTSATDNWDYIAYSGGQNVSIVDHIIDISGTKSLSGDGKNIEVVELADTFIISATKDIVDKSYVDNNFVSKTDFGTYSGNTKNQIDSKLDISAFTAYSATALNDYYKKSETSGKTEIQDALAEKQDNLTNEQLSAISSVSAIQSNTENWNAAYDTLTAYSADGKWLIADDITALATKNEVEIASGVLTAQTNYLSGIIDTKLDTITFTAYSAHALDNYYNIQETDNLIDDLSATVDNRLTNKLDTSAFTAYSADVKTQIDSKLNKTDFDDYSARALNDYYTKNETDAEITNAINDISATVSTDYLKKADVQEYTAGNNIDITNYVISGRDWTPELNTKVNNIDFTAYSADAKTQIDSKLNKSDFDDYSAHALDDYYTKSETSGKNEIQNALAEKQNNLSNEQLSAISSVSAIQAISGDWATKTEVENTSAILTAQTNYLSGIVDNKLDITAFDTALNDYYTKTETNTLVDNSIADISATVSADYLKKADVREYTAGNNIDITNYVISGRDWMPELNTKVNNTDFNAYSASTKTQIDSKLNKTDFNTYSAHADTTPYSGINGIKVENHLISVSANYALSADVYSKSEVNDIRDVLAKELAGLGFYDCKSDEIKANGEPNETVLEARELLSNNKIYLVKDNTAPVPDQYKEWIWDGTNWTCIGDTSISLVAYAKTQDVIASAIATSAWINDTFYDKTETSGSQQIADALNTKLNTSIFTTYSANVKTQIDSKLNKSDFDDYSAHALNDYYKKSETSGKNEIQTALGTKLDTTVFNDYTATALNNYYTKDETSGKNEIQNALNTKLDTTAFNDYTATALNDIATNSGNWNASYTALTANSGNWNNTYNTVTTNSGKWENSYTALTANSASWLKEADVAGFATKTELNNASSILINQDNYLSGVIDTKLDTTAFNNYSANALNDYYKKSETSGKTEIQNALGTKLDTTAFNNYSANVKTQIDSKLTKNDFDSYSAAVDNDIDYISAAVSSIPAQVQSDWEETNTTSPAYIQNKPVDLEMSAGNGISITETNNTLVFAVSGNYADATEVNNKLTALSANKLDISATTGWDISAYSAGNNITIVDHVIDLRESKNLIGDGENIIVTESGSNIIVSALKDILDKDDFDSYSAIIDDDIDYLSAAIEDSILSAGTDLKIENDIISVNTNGTANSAYMAFVEGSATIASGKYSHAEGGKTSAIGTSTHAEGIDTKATGEESHAEGWGTFASGHNSHAEGNYTKACGSNSHAEGYHTLAYYNAHAEGDSTSALGQHSHAEGQFTITNNNCAHAEGQHASAMSLNSHAEGGWTIANNNCSHAEGNCTSALGHASHAEGDSTIAFIEMSHAEGNYTSALGHASHAEGGWTVANSDYSHAEGKSTSALGYVSHAEGSGTVVDSSFAHAEGLGTSALELFSHAEGHGTIASGEAMHAGGMFNKTSADALYVIGNGSADSARSDAFIIYPDGSVSAQGKISANGVELGATPLELSAGINTKIENNIIDVKNISCSATGSGNIALGTSSIADGKNSFVYGLGGAGAAQNIASGDHSIILGWHSKAIGRYSTVLGGNYCLASADVDPNYEPPYSGGPVAQGLGTSSLGHYTHSEGIGTIASNQASHAEGGATSSLGAVAHAEGDHTLASGEGSHAEGKTTFATGKGSHAEGGETSAVGNGSHAEGVYTLASGINSHAEGGGTSAIGVNSHTEGEYTLADAEGSHAEGERNSAHGDYSHAEGCDTLAFGYYSHAEGDSTSASGDSSHAEGYLTLASGDFSHAEGIGTSAIGHVSHAEGSNTIAGSDNMHVAGTYNKTSANALYVIGNGTYDDARSDAFIITSAGLASATILATSGIPDVEAAITSIPAQVQTDWEETNTASPAYIQNKPVDLEMSAGNGISITEVNDTLVFSVSGKLDTTAFNGYSAEIDDDIDYLSAAIEDSCVKYNDIQYAIGSANTATGSTTARYSVALGNSNSAYNSFVIGNYNKGKESYIFGNSNSGINSYIVGNSCTGTESYLFGKELSGKSWGIELGDFGDTGYPVIVGRQNATKTSAYFVVGCGNTLGNADAFIVSSNKVASAADFKAGNGVSLSSLTGLATSSWVNGQIADAITSIPAQVQSDWSATNTASPAYILNKPNQIDMQCGTYLDITSANNQITIDADISAISAALSDYANIQSDWSATNTASPAYIQNKPDVLVPVDSPAALGGISKPTNIMVVSAMPASPDSATIYLVQGTMIGN